jgi:hypothetical protein
MMRPNSIYVDRRLFPTVAELTILDARSIFDSRLKDSEGEHTIRLDIYSVAWDGTNVFGTDKSYLIGRNLPPHKGATRLRHVLGGNVEAFTHIICDPQQPDVVALVGPSPIPQNYGEEFKVTPLADLLETSKFATLDNVTKATMAMMKYVSTNNPNALGATVLGLGNNWSIECVTTLGEAPTFFVREDVARAEGQNPEEVRDE